MIDRTEQASSLIQRIRVPLGFLFGVVFLVIAHPTMNSLLPGLLLGFSGLLIRTWAAGHLRKHQELTVSGPYRWTRNPLYLGSLIMGTGLCIASGIYWLLIGFIPIFLAVYLPVMQREELELKGSEGNRYKEYQKSVPLFFPRIPRGRCLSEARFSWSWFIYNREYNAVIGYLIISLYLVSRIYWP